MRGNLSVPVTWTGGQTQAEAPEVVSVGEEELPELEASGESPGWAFVVAAVDAARVLSTFAVVHVGQREGQAGLGDEDLLAVH